MMRRVANHAARHHATPGAASAAQKAARRRRVDREENRENAHHEHAQPTTHETPLRKKGSEPTAPNATSNPARMLIPGKHPGKRRRAGAPPDRHGRYDRTPQAPDPGRVQNDGGRGSLGLPRPPVNRTCRPPANGVEHCETDADRAVTGTCFSEDPDQRVGVGTSDGTRRQVEMSLVVCSSGRGGRLQRMPVPAPA